MTEYWRQSPNYWCKHCATYVRDTKLERQNHEATAKHQNAIKRSLRDLHRNHEREEREKERARREINRLNDVVADAASLSSSGQQRHGGAAHKAAPFPANTSTESSLKKQREQLAELGVSIPNAFRSEMAMPGEWTVTSTRVVVEQEGDGASKEKFATGVRKRDRREEEVEERDAVQGLFKKPRQWGRDTKALLEGEDEELDALLSGSVKLKKQDAEQEEEDTKTTVKREETNAGLDGSDITPDAGGSDDVVKTEEGHEAKVKLEEGEDDAGGTEKGIAPVVFKKRKPKGLRTK
ncbi:U1 zinc finger family protein [Moelleriella libera RCEF 2490]|uniref:U1 zinc finger family protein n=1 Tax=Moelleriella libera RCEF 2490 TaxID=1081109 RepID=A0A162ICI5_9HYPO|nr:U1 zinc finger family protein [Moelleriella libera RCEF 2490]